MVQQDAKAIRFQGIRMLAARRLAKIPPLSELRTFIPPGWIFLSRYARISPSWPVDLNPSMNESRRSNSGSPPWATCAQVRYLSSPTSAAIPHAAARRRLPSSTDRIINSVLRGRGKARHALSAMRNVPNCRSNSTPTDDFGTSLMSGSAWRLNCPTFAFTNSDKRLNAQKLDRNRPFLSKNQSRPPDFTRHNQA